MPFILFHSFRAVSLMEMVAQLSVLHPQSHYARSIFALSSWMLYISLAMFLLVAGLVTRASWRFRVRAGEAEPKQVFGSTKGEMAYFLGPTVLLAVVFGFTLHVMHTGRPSGAGRLRRLVFGRADKSASARNLPSGTQDRSYPTLASFAGGPIAIAQD